MKKKLTLSLLIISILFFAVVQVKAEESIFLKGIESFYQENYEKAIDQFAKAIKEGSHIIDALYYQSLAYIEVNDIMKAKENIKTLSEKGYRFGMIHWKLGEVYLNEKGQFDSPFYNEAKKEFETAKELGINAPAFHSDLAMAYHGLGNLEKAAIEYEKALKENGDLGDIINLASIYKKTGQVEKAIKTYEKALEKDATNTSIYLNMGGIYLKQNKYQKAIEILNKGADINSTFVPLKVNLAIAYYKNGNIGKAKEEFKKVIDLNNNYYEAYFYLGEIAYYAEENTQRAIYYYEEAIRRNPDYTKAYIALGDVYLEEGNAYRAISQYTTAIEKNPTYPDGHYHLALAYHSLGMKEAAIAELRRTLHLNSEYREARELLNSLLEE